MSRRKPVPAVAGVAKRTKKANNLHARPEKIPLGEILTDAFNVPWKVGPSIGTGGFGEIYCAYCFSHATPKNTAAYPNVIKIEPHDNGPLFVETHFYRKVCKVDDIERYRKLRKLKHLGMPQYLASGSHTLNGLKHRFLVIPRFSVSLQSVYMQNNKCLPLPTVYRAGLQMLDVLEYIHSNQYVHADLKGDNILFGTGDRGRERLYLVDFGMACRIVVEDQFKPDPRKKHNGTIEYTSRDAHQGVMTMRGDLEILAYNLIEWAGGSLPWKEEKLLKDCNKVQQMKEEAMGDVAGMLKRSFRQLATIPKAMQPFLECVIGLRYNETPKYGVCAKTFEKALKTIGATNAGALEVSVAGSSVNDSSGPMNKTKSKKRRTLDTIETNGLTDTVLNTPDEIENSEEPGPSKRSQRSYSRTRMLSPSILKDSKGRTLPTDLADTVPNTINDDDDDDSPFQRPRRAEPIVEDPDSPVATISQALSKRTRSPKTERVRQPVKVKDGKRSAAQRNTKTVTVARSSSAQGINIRIETPRKKRTRNGTSESPQEITIKLRLDAQVSVNTRSKRNETIVVSTTQQNMSFDSSRNESLEASQDVIDLSSATEDNNRSRNIFDDC